jgi:transcription elongation factor GreA
MPRIRSPGGISGAAPEASDRCYFWFVTSIDETTPPSKRASAADLLRSVGLMADGPSILGSGIRAIGPGVYIIELPGPLASAPIDLGAVNRWLARVPLLELDGEHPTPKQLSARLAAFWIPSATVVYVGSTTSSIGGRVAALANHVLGDPRPHAASQWLKVLDVRGFRVWWAATPAPEEHEDALLDAFAVSVPPTERDALLDTAVVLPFANLRTVTGDAKRHGLRRMVLPIEPATPTGPTRVVDLPPGDAIGSRPEPRGAGTTRRTNAARPRAATARTRATPAPRATRAKAQARPPGEPVVLSADGAEQLKAELDELTTVRRPEVIARVRSARQLGDLKENSEYAAAREEQSFLEGRIQSIEAHLRTGVVAETATADRVSVGSHVTVEVEGEPRELTIVGARESDPSSGKISYESPVGRALVGKTVGEDAVIRTPGGEVTYRIVAIV